MDGSKRAQLEIRREKPKHPELRANKVKPSCKKSDISGGSPRHAWLCKGGVGPGLPKSGAGNKSSERDMPQMDSRRSTRPEDLAGEELPGCERSGAGKEEPKDTCEKAGAEGPGLAKDLKDIRSPMWLKSSEDELGSGLVPPIADNGSPKHVGDRTGSELPNFRKSDTDSAGPNRIKLCTDEDKPMLM